MDRLVDEVVAHLRRHESHAGSADLAADTVEEALRSLATGAATVWVRVEWDGSQPVLRGRASATTFAPPAAAEVLEGGVWLPDHRAKELAEALPAERSIEVSLPVTRAPEAEVEIPAVDTPRPADGRAFVGTVAATLAGRDRTGMTVEQACAAAGTAAAATAIGRWAETHGGDNPRTPADIGDAVTQFLNDAGGDFFAVESGPERVVLGNRRCPFGKAVESLAPICNCTSALAGSLGATAAGRRTFVVLDETIAAGDHRCRAVIDLAGDPTPYGHAYVPGEERPARRLPPAEPVNRFRVALTLQLPRDRQSVALTRHLIRHALHEIGVRQADVSDVLLAVSEAASNVIEHADVTDAYQITFTLGPEAAEIRVVDTGHGFDYQSLSSASAGPESERGRGLQLMSALVDHARFVSRPEQGTVVHLIKRLHYDRAPAGWLGPR
ncbi:MAG TPA: ATP-binding protein [Acidimicrobiales bacterium]|nr:ATP-binding protein [Acidimicrobiales bacterium]